MSVFDTVHSMTVTQKRELDAEQAERLLKAQALVAESTAAYRALVLQLAVEVGVNAVCRAAGISTAVYADWKAKASER